MRLTSIFLGSLFFCSYVAAILPASSLHQLVRDDQMIDTRVAELDFTSEWFTNHTTFPANLPCQLPSQHHRLTFGLGYDSVAAEVETATCWVSHQHRQAGNLDVDFLVKSGAQLVHGAGVSELLLVSIVSAAKQFHMSGHKEKPIVTMHLSPYYAILKTHCQSFSMKNIVEWMEPKDVSSHSLKGRPLIIVAITPSNPSGSIGAGLLDNCTDDPHSRDQLVCFGSQTRLIADHSFLWPCTVRPELRTSGHWKWPLRPSRESALLFGLSKLSGHSGLRHGWAWVPDPSFAAIMRETLWEMGLSLSASSLSHSSSLLAAISHDFHEWCESTMDSRWTQLTSLPMFQSGKCFTLHSEVRTAVAVIQCEMAADCEFIFRKIGVAVMSGKQYGMSQSAVRIAIGQSEKQFQKLVSRLGAVEMSGCR